MLLDDRVGLAAARRAQGAIAASRTAARAAADPSMVAAATPPLEAVLLLADVIRWRLKLLRRERHHVDQASEQSYGSDDFHHRANGIARLIVNIQRTAPLMCRGRARKVQSGGRTFQSTGSGCRPRIRGRHAAA
jgi:hypothetical protein